MNGRRFSLLVAVALGFIACGDDGDSAGSPAAEACKAQCAAQAEQGCGIGDSCEALCDAYMASLDADCQTKAKTAYDCNLSNNEVCGAITACSAEADAFIACSQGGASSCVSCGDFLTNDGGNPEDLCGYTNGSCEPDSSCAKALDINACTCDASVGCAAECPVTCDTDPMGDDSGCQACATTKCSTELDACLNDA